MGFPGNNSWQYYDADSYWQAREAAGIPQPASTTQAPHVPPAAGADDLAGQFADLRLGRPERHRASDAGATLAPRGAAPGIGGSMRLPPSAAAALVGRDSFHSARMPYVPESPPDSPEPYAAPQPTRHSSAYASYTTRHEAAPRRKGGFMSGFTKSLKKAFGFGSSRRKDSYSRNAGASSSHHSTDASLRPPPVSRVSSGRTSGTLHRMDSAPQSPERVQVRLSDADRETNLDPAEFRSQSIPTSPGTRSDCELLAHSFGREHGAELAYAPWAGPMGMPPAPHWQPLAPSPWESAFAHWDAADAAQMAHHDAGMSSHAMGAGPFQAGPSSSTLPPQQLWAPPAFGLQPVGPAMSSMNLGRGIEAMELMHQDLFTSPSIASVAGRRAVVPPVMSTRDVDMDECLVVNTAAGEYDSIGTLGVATCFAMRARSERRRSNDPRPPAPLGRRSSRRQDPPARRPATAARRDARGGRPGRFDPRRWRHVIAGSGLRHSRRRMGTPRPAQRIQHPWRQAARQFDRRSGRRVLRGRADDEEQGLFQPESVVRT